VSTRSTRWSPQEVVRKLKAAIYECVLRTVFATQSLQPVLAGRHSAGADSVLAQFLRLLSLMPRRLPLAASDIPSRQPKYGASARQVCVRLRRPLGEGRGASQCRAPKPGCRNTYSTARIAASPHLEMPPFPSVSPEAYFFGVRPR
jgi:hypothetical protein